jgi:hypothetical protein
MSVDFWKGYWCGALIVAFVAPIIRKLLFGW